MVDEKSDKIIGKLIAPDSAGKSPLVEFWEVIERAASAADVSPFDEADRTNLLCAMCELARSDTAYSRSFVHKAPPG